MERQPHVGSRLNRLAAETSDQFPGREVLPPGAANRKLLERDDAGDKAFVGLEPGSVGGGKQHRLVVEPGSGKLAEICRLLHAVKQIPGGSIFVGAEIMSGVGRDLAAP